jgi:tetratricopeptide (TPR) repeat protein
MSIFYPYPALVGGSMPGLYYLYLLPAAALLLAAWFFRNSAPYITFGISFFTINILLVLQLFSPGMSAMADHYTYLSYLGLIFAVLMLINTLIQRATAVKVLPRIAIGAGLVVLIVFGTISNARVRHWQNDETMANELLGQYPTNYVALNNMGFVLHSQGQSAPAITYCMQAISQKKDYPYPYVNAINAAIALNDINFAAGLADSAARFVKPTPDILNSIGYVALIQNRLDDAIVSYKKTIAMQPTNRNAYLALAEIYYRKKDYTTELAILNKGLQHLPNNPILLNYKGYALYTTGRYNEAILMYDKALSLAPDYKAASENRTTCLKAMNVPR